MSRKKGSCNSKLYRTFSYYSFYNYWTYFNLGIFFFAWYFYSNFQGVFFCCFCLFVCFFFSKPLFSQKKKLKLKTYNSTLLDIYRISVGAKLKNIKRKENINNQGRICEGMIGGGGGQR